MANFLIIAASSSMGRATCKLLQDEGHCIYQTARSSDKITPDSLLDATDFQAVGRVFSLAKEKMGSIDGVVNFAGSLLLKPASSTSEDQYYQVIQSSLTTAFATVRSAGQHIDNGGSVVLISSAAASIGLPNHEAIAAAKAGVIGLMRSAAATYAHQNLRFNVVAPGLTETHLTEKIIQNKASLDYSLQMHPLGRIGQPQDIARAVLFFLDPKNSWVTGQTLHVDGGLSILKVPARVKN
jgi:3-oxoacyl-[acyl-carrier protein] reductase